MSPPPAIPPDPDDESGPAAEEFARALADFERAARSAAAAVRAGAELRVGTKVRGSVVTIGAEHALLDIGARCEAIADLSPFRNEDGSLQIAVGDTLELFVVESGDQIVLARSVRSDPGSALRQVREAHAAGVPITGRVTGLNAGGLEVDLGGARGFCPLSQIESGFCADPSTYVGRTLEFLVTGVEESRRNAVLSRRQLQRRAEEEETRRRLASLRPGDELDGTVARLEPFGAFVTLAPGIDGMVHVSEIQHARVAHPRDVLNLGERVRVSVLRIEPGKDQRPRIALSIKASAPDPWTDIVHRFPVGLRVKGVVANLAEFGAFVTLAPGIDGLVHISEIAAQRTQRVKDALAQGQEVEAIILAVDPAKRRISLSIRAAQAAEEPAAAAGDAGAGNRQPAPEAARPEAPPAPPADAPLTTMAIALRAAAERARRK